LGIRLDDLLVVMPAHHRDANWALHQALACPAVATVVGWPEKLDDRMFRRLQLAAENGCSVGFLVRPALARGSPSWADVRLLVEASPSAGKRRFRVSVLYCRGGSDGAAVELEWCDETHTLYLAPAMAAATPAGRSSGA
jgi:protein ImuA